MAQLGTTFDASQVDPSQPHETLPPGDYRVQIINSEMRVTKAGTGQYLWLEMDILDGPSMGKKIFDRLNLINPSRQTEEIAQRTLSAICHAIGQMQVTDSEELHFKPLQVKLAVSKDGYNEVKGYKAATTTSTQRPTFQTKPVQKPVQQQMQQPVQQPVQQQVQQAVQQPVQQQMQQPIQQPVQQQVQQPVQQQIQQPVQQSAQQPPPQVTRPVSQSGGVGPWRRMG